MVWLWQCRSIAEDIHIQIGECVTVEMTVIIPTSVDLSHEDTL